MILFKFAAQRSQPPFKLPKEASSNLKLVTMILCWSSLQQTLLGSMSGHTNGWLNTIGNGSVSTPLGISQVSKSDLTTQD